MSTIKDEELMILSELVYEKQWKIKRERDVVLSPIIKDN